jgi:hypothetical protein
MLSFEWVALVYPPPEEIRNRYLIYWQNVTSIESERFVTKSVALGELFDFACNPVHQGVNANQPRVTLSAFFVSRLSLQGLPHSRRLPRVSVPNMSASVCGRNRPIGSKIGLMSLDLLSDDRHKLTTRSPPRPARDTLPRRDFSTSTADSLRSNRPRHLRQHPGDWGPTRKPFTLQFHTGRFNGQKPRKSRSRSLAVARGSTAPEARRA